MDFLYFDIQIGLEWKKVDKNEYRSEQKRNPDHVFLRQKKIDSIIISMNTKFCLGLGNRGNDV